ncbi:MAG: hypothetical protein H0W08_19390 [Acidobacteria bacterium]|nr:hypothetical protein [Acidobacteriota bacterium]
MSKCAIQEAGHIELYFYSELHGDEQSRITAHLRQCRECAVALEELTVIQAALSARPHVSAPPSGDWSAFMERLDAAVQARTPIVVPFKSAAVLVHRPWVGLLATAALLAVVTISVFLASSAGRRALRSDDGPAPAELSSAAGTADGKATPIQSGLASVGARHLERSKLVVLGLAAKPSAVGGRTDWAYERELATSLLNDTRLYRMAAEERGLTSLADVMRDLELVLLQTSMAEATDATALPQIQRLIHKRGLVQKMDVSGSIGLVP